MCEGGVWCAGRVKVGPRARRGKQAPAVVQRADEVAGGGQLVHLGAGALVR